VQLAVVQRVRSWFASGMQAAKLRMTWHTGSRASATKSPTPPIRRARSHPRCGAGCGRVTQPGRIYYPFAYGKSTVSRTGSMGSSEDGHRALMSFPYRYISSYRGPAEDLVVVRAASLNFLPRGSLRCRRAA